MIVELLSDEQRLQREQQRHAQEAAATSAKNAQIMDQMRKMQADSITSVQRATAVQSADAAQASQVKAKMLDRVYADHPELSAQLEHNAAVLSSARQALAAAQQPPTLRGEARERALQRLEHEEILSQAQQALTAAEQAHQAATDALNWRAREYFLAEHAAVLRDYTECEARGASSWVGLAQQTLHVLGQFARADDALSIACRAAYDALVQYSKHYEAAYVRLRDLRRAAGAFGVAWPQLLTQQEQASGQYII